MSHVFTPVVDANGAYGEGDWRPLLSGEPRKAGCELYMIGKQSIEHKLRGVILPSYDWTMSIDDKAFAASVAACWSNTPDKRLPRHFTPTAFALPLLVYPFMGEKKEHWFSPSNRKNMIGGDTASDEDCADAFDDLNRWIRRNKAFSDAKKDFFVKAPSMKEDALVPGRSLRFFALSSCYDKEQSWHNAMIGLTQTAYSYIIEQLRWLHRQEDGPARDPNWPQYMLGDPTDPSGALEWHVDKMQLDPKDAQETNVVCFTERVEFLDDKPKVRKISPEVLAARFMLPDPANWNIPTYEEQVLQMMNTYDAAISAEMIRAACGARFRGGELPKDRPEHIRLTGNRAPDDRSPDEETPRRGRAADEETPRRGRTSREEGHEPEGDPMTAVTGGNRGSRVAPAPNANPPMPEKTVAKPATEKPAAANPDATYWAGPAGAKPTKKTVKELQAMADAEQIAGVKVMRAPNDWVNLAESGLVRLPDKKSPAAVPSDEPPAVPDDEPPAVPGNASSGTVTRDGMKARLFPDAGMFDSLDPAQKAKAESLIDRAWKATNEGRNSELPDDVVSGLMDLVV